MRRPSSSLPLLTALALLPAALGAAAGNSSVPNLIIIGLDGKILPITWEVTYDKLLAASGVTNPNGCRLPMTWFSCCCLHGKVSGDCEVVRRAYELGHEMATHTMTHSEQTLDYSYQEWEQEIGGQRDWLAQECGVPAEQVVGFRAPNFRINNLMGQVLADLQFEYDSSLPDITPIQRAGQMNAGFDLSPCEADAEQRERCGDWDELPLWEVPAYKLPGSGKRMDPKPVGNMSVVERFQMAFMRKRGSGAPVSINVHQPYLEDSANRDSLITFLQWAFKQPGETWVLTHQQYVDWLQAPPGTPVADIVARYPCDRDGTAVPPQDSGSSGSGAPAPAPAEQLATAPLPAPSAS